MITSSSKSWGEHVCPNFAGLVCTESCPGRERAQMEFDNIETVDFSASGCYFNIPRKEEESSRDWYVKTLHATRALNKLHEKLCPELIEDKTSLGTFWVPGAMLENEEDGLHMVFKQPNIQIPEVCMYRLMRRRYQDYVSKFVELEKHVIGTGTEPVCLVSSFGSKSPTLGSSVFTELSEELINGLKFVINGGAHTAGAILTIPLLDVDVTLPNPGVLSKIARSPSRHASCEDRYDNVLIGSVSESLDMIELDIIECSTDAGFSGATKASLPRLLFSQCRNTFRQGGVKEIRDLKDKWMSFNAYPSYRPIHWAGAGRTGALVSRPLRVGKTRHDLGQKTFGFR